MGVEACPADPAMPLRGSRGTPRDMDHVEGTRGRSCGASSHTQHDVTERGGRRPAPSPCHSSRRNVRHLERSPQPPFAPSTAGGWRALPFQPSGRGENRDAVPAPTVIRWRPRRARRDSPLAETSAEADAWSVEEPVIERAEVVALLFNVSDIARAVARIQRLLEEDDGEEEAD